jgi:hypothetical protein
MWISVKDKMPPIDSCVVVIRKDATPAVAYFIATKKFYYFCIGQDVEQTWEPEYWLPIPPYPGEQYFPKHIINEK